MRVSIPRTAALLALAALPLPAREKLTELERVGIIRGLSFEYATTRIQVPRAKKALALAPD
ncbi:MAG: hypothetical protein NTY38_31455, partial [Acidobacteria bacterium]|nr:hypothetical protein [Acidobacteriota bacterium]